MIPVDIIEEHRYPFKVLKDKFKTKDEETRILLNKLKNYGIVKFVNKSNEENLAEFLEKDIEDDFIGDNTEYVFRYVGLLLVHNFVIKCYPKYFKTDCNFEDFKQIIEVLKKYTNSRKEPISFQEDINISNFNLLSIMIYLIENYFANGLYDNYQNIIETNGNGEILWNKSIDDFYPVIQNNRPYYVELYTTNTIRDDNNYFKLLHELILTKCSKDLEDANLLSLFELTSINLSYKDFDDFGGKEHIKYMIRRELNIQFNSYKQSLLKAMYLYVDKSDSYLGDVNYFDAFGTTSYNLVWEDVCREVLGIKFDKKLIDLNLIKEIDSKYIDKNLSEVISKHLWYFWGGETMDGDPLKPDLITINKKDNETQFIIFDAKYYNLEKNNKPGLGDVTKQFLYELVFTEFIELHNLTPKNCFLFPIDGENIVHKGYIEFEMFNSLNLEKNKLKLQKIQVILLPAKKMNECYLKSGKLECNIRNELMHIIKNDDELDYSKEIYFRLLLSNSSY